MVLDLTPALSEGEGVETACCWTSPRPSPKERELKKHFIILFFENGIKSLWMLHKVLETIEYLLYYF
jgi:hypothetical protein